MNTDGIGRASQRRTCSTMREATGITRAVHLSNRSPERLELSLINVFLALKDFEQFQNLLHFIERGSQGFDDCAHFLNRLLDRSSRRGLVRLVQRYRDFGFPFGTFD